MRGSTSKCLVVPRGRNKCKNGDAGFLASGSQLLIYLPLREAEPCNPGFCMASSFPLDSARNGCQGCLQDGRSLSQIASCDSQLPPTTLGTLHPPSNSSCLPVAAAESIFPRTHHQQVPTISRYSASAGTQHQQLLTIVSPLELEPGSWSLHRGLGSRSGSPFSFTIFALFLLFPGPGAAAASCICL